MINSFICYIVESNMDPVIIKEEGDLEPQAKPSSWHRPPAIVPNYGPKSKKNNILPKSKVQHVLLHDNKYQKNILNSQVSHMSAEYKRSSRLFELHKRSFLIRQSMKQVNLWERGIEHIQIVPDMIVELHCPGTSRQAALQSPIARRMASLSKELNLKEQEGMQSGSMFSPLDRPVYRKSMDVFEPLPEEGSSMTVEPLSNGQATTSVTTMTKLNKSQIMENRLAKSSKSHISEDRLTKSSCNQLPDERLAKSSKSLVNREQSTRSIPLDRTETHDSRPTTNTRKRKYSIQRQRSNYFDRGMSAATLPNDSGITRTFSTYNNSRRREHTLNNIKPHDGVITQDPRFQLLKKQLVPPDKPVDGFLQLSPGGRKVIQKYGGSLYKQHELEQLLEKYNSMNFMSPKRIESAKMKMKVGKQRIMSVKEAFVDDRSEYSSLANSSLVLSEAE